MKKIGIGSISFIRYVVYGLSITTNYNFIE